MECIVLQQAVGVQEENNLTGSSCRPFIHLKSSTPWGVNEQVGVGGDLPCAISAAAIGYDDLVRLLPSEAGQCLRKAAFLVQSRYDDGHAHVPP